MPKISSGQAGAASVGASLRACMLVPRGKTLRPTLEGLSLFERSKMTYRCSLKGWQHECERTRAGTKLRHRETDQRILRRSLSDLSCAAGARAGQAHGERVLFPDPL